MGDLVADSYRVLDGCREHLLKFFIVYGANDVRHIEIHTAEPLVPEPSAYETEIGI
jgi:hypothetical protein